VAYIVEGREKWERLLILYK